MTVFALSPRTSTGDDQAVADYNEIVAMQQAQASMEAAEKAKAIAAMPVAAFMGDSFTTGSGSTKKETRWTSLVSTSAGWKELNFGFGGTNYGTDGAQKGGISFSGRVPEIVAANPDIVVVSSGGNSLNVDQSAGIQETFTALRKGLPDARIIATSPYSRSGPYPFGHVEFGEKIRTAVESVNGEYLDIGHPLGDFPDAMAADGTHPNDVGHQLIAEAVGAKLGK